MEQLTRRGLVAGLGALGLLAGCGGGAVGARGGAGPAGGIAPPPRPVPNPAFDAWLDRFRPRALARGIPQATLSAALRDAGFLPLVVERDRNQTEFTRTTEDYLAIAASDERLSVGRGKVAGARGVLAAVEGRYGVQADIVAAVWGLESFFGTRRGNIPVISALATLAFDGRRGAFFESQLIAALRILAAGEVTPARMVGSWAGAMGHTQFIPTSYLAHAVDFTGDGRRDIWGEDPSDALASTAAYLDAAGWVRGQPWGLEVRLPADFPLQAAGRGRARAVAAWEGMGVRAATGGGLPDHGPGAILAPAGTRGPGFLVFRNFSVILRYNNAENYALGIGHLSDRLAGRGALRQSFPPDAQGLTLADRQEMQRRLTARGFDTGGADGVVGARTRSAIEAFQRARGLPVTGAPSAELLRALR